MLVAILIIFLFASLVLLHEWGHFITARRGGVEVEEFGFGFPPRLYGRKIRGTLYSLNLLPLGGFVRLRGEDEGDRGPGTFNHARYSVKARILLAGVGMNLITAFIILYVLCITGLPAIGPGFEPTFLKSSYAQPKQLILAQVEPGSPAARAGLQRGDYVLKVDSKVMVTDEDLRAYSKSHAGQDVTIYYRRGQADRQVRAHLRDPNVAAGYLGVVSQQVYKLRYDPLRAVVAAGYIVGALFVATIVGVVQLIIHIPVLIGGLFKSAVPKEAATASGPLGIIFILKSISALGLSYVFLFMANISVALAAFNVLPLPALDGGRLAIITAQRLTRRRISAETEAKIHATGFFALIALMLIISVYDLKKGF